MTGSTKLSSGELVECMKALERMRVVYEKVDGWDDANEQAYQQIKSILEQSEQKPDGDTGELVKWLNRRFEQDEPAYQQIKTKLMDYEWQKIEIKRLAKKLQKPKPVPREFMERHKYSFSASDDPAKMEELIIAMLTELGHTIEEEK